MTTICTTSSVWTLTRRPSHPFRPTSALSTVQAEQTLGVETRTQVEVISPAVGPCHSCAHPRMCPRRIGKHASKTYEVDGHISVFSFWLATSSCKIIIGPFYFITSTSHPGLTNALRRSLARLAAIPLYCKIEVDGQM
ncbi:hypothetical protein A4X13_0g7133 [Tilletia indica]|uniref:Uncharacterized protein n=1 Tax=Tilletia indica TaxID=43049 RepID=A0A8T8SLC8_9BASI|nr:hypothetical protein A4X13_0g7133 [Tilletia indica]